MSANIHADMHIGTMCMLSKSSSCSVLCMFLIKLNHFILILRYVIFFYHCVCMCVCESQFLFVPIRYSYTLFVCFETGSVSYIALTVLELDI